MVKVPPVDGSVTVARFRLKVLFGPESQVLPPTGFLSNSTSRLDCKMK